MLVLAIDDPDSLGLGLVYVSDDELATLLVYVFPGDVDEGRELAAYSLASFRYGAVE